MSVLMIERRLSASELNNSEYEQMDEQYCLRELGYEYAKKMHKKETLYLVEFFGNSSLITENKLREHLEGGCKIIEKRTRYILDVSGNLKEEGEEE